MRYYITTHNALGPALQTGTHDTNTEDPISVIKYLQLTDENWARADISDIQIHAVLDDVESLCFDRETVERWLYEYVLKRKDN